MAMRVVLFCSIVNLAFLCRIEASTEGVRENGGNCFGVSSCRPRCITFKVHRDNSDCGSITGGFLNDDIWRYDNFKATNCDKGGPKNKCKNEKCGKPLPANLTIRIGEEFDLQDTNQHRYFYTIVDLPEGQDMFTFCSLYYCDGYECALPEQMGYELQMEMRDMAQRYSQEEAPKNNEFEEASVSLVLEVFFQPYPKELMSLYEKTQFGPLEIMWFDDPAGCSFNSTTDTLEGRVPISPPTDPLILTLDESPRYGISSHPISASYCSGDDYDLAPLPVSLTGVPSASPSWSMSPSTSVHPTVSLEPSLSDLPTQSPSAEPTNTLTDTPSLKPSSKPSAASSKIPSSFPSTKPTNSPSSFPTRNPTDLPTSFPTSKPSDVPTSSLNPTDVVIFSDNIRTRLTLAPVPSAMDSSTLLIFENVANNFIQKTRPWKGRVPATLVVKVMNQTYYQDRSSFLNERQLQEAALDIVIDMNGEYEKRGADYSFDNDMLHGFRSNLPLFLEDLAAASSFFAALTIVEGPAKLEQEKIDSGGNIGGSTLNGQGWLLICVLACAFIVATMLTIHRHARNQKKMKEGEGGSKGSSAPINPPLGIAPRDFSIQIFDEEEQAASYGGNIVVAITPRNNCEEDSDSFFTVSDSVRRTLIIDITEDKEKGEENEQVSQRDDDSSISDDQQHDNEELLRAVKTVQKMSLSRKTNYSDPEGMRILNDLESVTVGSRNDMPKEIIIASPCSEEVSTPSPKIISPILPVHSSKSDRIEDDELSDDSSYSEYHEDTDQSSLPFDVKAASAGNNEKQKEKSTRMVEKVVVVPQITFGNACSSNFCAEISPTCVTPVSGNRDPFKVKGLSNREGTGSTSKRKSPITKLKDIARRISISPRSLPVLSISASPRTTTPQKTHCNTEVCAINSDGDEFQNSYPAIGLKSRGDEINNQLLHKNYRKSDE